MSKDVGGKQHVEGKLMADAQKGYLGDEYDRLQIFDDEDSDEEYDGLYDEMMQK